MSDYGRDLQFGTFLTPDAAQPDRVVELGLLTEAAGLDLATVQDHPYQARFLDSWALIGTIAARTSTLRLTTNVTNLPLRPPYVLAKTVASLDLLSRGRIELGLGAGAFWDAVAAAGGPRRTPKEAVAALAEGIEIIRATWGHRAAVRPGRRRALPGGGRSSRSGPGPRGRDLGGRGRAPDAGTHRPDR